MTRPRLPLRIQPVNGARRMYRLDNPDSAASTDSSKEARGNLLSDVWSTVEAHPYLAASAGACVALAGIVAFRFGALRTVPNAFRFSGNLEEAGTAAYVRQSFPAAQQVMDHVLPLNLRIQLTQRSPMYSQELATRFTRQIENAFPNVDQALQKAVQDQNALTRWGNPAAVEHFERELERIKTAVQPVIASTAREAGFPTPVFEIAQGMKSRGTWAARFNSVRISPDVKTKGDFATTSYHELTHAEQTHVVTRKLADDLGLPAIPTTEQRAQLLKAYTETFRVDTKTLDYRALGKKRLGSYIDDSLSLRNGVRLSPEQEARANDLIKSHGNADPWRSRMAQFLKDDASLGDSQKKHLLYRSTLREIEAWTAAGLVG